MAGTNYVEATGALPTGVTEGTAYFARNVTTNTFEVSTTSGGASIATSGTQSGIFNVMTGSDSNSGLVNSASGALLTLQAAYNIVTSSLDLGGKNVTISAAAAPFTAGVLISQPWTGGGGVILEGNSAARISASGNVINWTCALPGQLTIQNFDGLSTSSGSVIRGDWVLFSRKQQLWPGHAILCSRLIYRLLYPRSRFDFARLGRCCQFLQCECRRVYPLGYQHNNPS
jgi:hypothetical protein